MDIKPTYDALKQRVKSIENEVIDLKKTLQELYRSHDYLEKLIRYANAPIIVWDPKIRIARFNPAFQHLTGLTPDEVVGKKLSLLFPESSQNESLKKISTSLNGEYWKSVEIPILCKNGDIRITLWNSANICDDDGTTVLATIAQGQDITERKQSEEALRDSEDRFQKLLNSVNDVVWAADLNGKMLYINTAAEAVFGKPSSEFLKNPKTWITAVHPEDRDETFVQSNLLLDKGRVENKYRIITKNGRIKWLIDKRSVVYDKTGNPVQIGGIATDITKQKIITKENIRINRALKLLSESNRIIVHGNDESQFFHDICKNIVGIGGYLLAWIGFAKQDRKKKAYPVAQYGFEDGLLDMLNISWADTKQGCDPAGTAIRENKPVICQNILTDPDFPIWRDEAVSRGCASAIALPIILNGHARGSLNIYAFEENGFGSDETELLEKIARC
ncbi:MAG: PAS domain S-box protein [Bacteroidales bacterium]|nr:PAS domain S-box protein [Bacteroidales bacterium]